MKGAYLECFQLYATFWNPAASNITEGEK